MLTFKYQLHSFSIALPIVCKTAGNWRNYCVMINCFCSSLSFCSSTQWHILHWTFVTFVLHHYYDTVKPVLKDHCCERPPVLKDQIFLSESPTFQCNWTCPNRPPVLINCICVWANGLVFRDRFYCGSIFIGPVAKVHAPSIHVETMAEAGMGNLGLLLLIDSYLLMIFFKDHTRFHFFK